MVRVSVRVRFSFSDRVGRSGNVVGRINEVTLYVGPG